MLLPGVCATLETKPETNDPVEDMIGIDLIIALTTLAAVAAGVWLFLRLSRSRRGALRTSARPLAAASGKPEPAAPIETRAVNWQDIAPHVKLGEFLQVRGRTVTDDAYLFILQPNAQRRFELVYGRVGRTPAKLETWDRSRLALAHNSTLRIWRLKGQGIQLESVDRGMESPRDLLGEAPFELVLSNVASLTTGNALHLASVGSSLETGFVKAWEIPTRQADAAMLADLSIEADVAHLADKIREVRRADQVASEGALARDEPRPGVCYVLGQWGGPVMSFPLTRDLALLVVAVFDPQTTLAKFLERLSLNPIMHARLLPRREGAAGVEPILVCPDAASGQHRVVRLTQSNAVLSLFTKEGDTVDVLKIVARAAETTGSAPPIQLSYLSTPEFQNVLVWCLPPSPDADRAAHGLEGETTLPKTPGAEAPPSAWCLVLGGSRRVPLREGVSILGRWPGVEVFVDDPSVSARHCELKVAGDSVEVRDLGSTNGTFAEGVRVGCDFLSVARSVQFGHLRGELESNRVEISIPALSAPEAIGVRYDDEGWPLCCQDPRLHATHECSVCGLTFHESQLHRVGLAGSGRRLELCPRCSNRCVSLGDSGPPRGRMQAWWGRFKKWATGPRSANRGRG